MSSMTTACAKIRRTWCMRLRGRSGCRSVSSSEVVLGCRSSSGRQIGILVMRVGRLEISPVEFNVHNTLDNGFESGKLLWSPCCTKTEKDRFPDNVKCGAKW